MANHSSMAGTYTFSVAVANGADLSRNADYVRQLRSGGLESQSRPYPGFPGHLDAVSHAADPYDSPALHYPQAMLQRKRHSFIPMLDTSVSPSSSGYSPSPSSASVPSPLSATLTSDPDDAWNLIPYHVSWGHEYEEYRAGTLPGPDGDCIFLRSPTPLRNQRASEACKKCRERKAKVRHSRCPLISASDRFVAVAVHWRPPGVRALHFARLRL
ncbi:hypothetical protein BV25DRAFT_1221552 [Artomyces pyxidatus]|uniref:Uncharacterized protein n=1 Tax=Artomyces pyxidatus TaxID=48021 RepID=A0ACB8SRI1_9AGAM|nr:hypothetical protein BV25DRAFT_1221552 [Artomyces pyxidatus]